MSSGSESDEDFVPGEPEQLSEEESADEETNLQYEKELEHKTKKRKAAEEAITKKKRHTRNGVKEIELEQVEEQEEVSGKPLDPVEEKKREEDLWAMFLEGTDTKPKPVAKETKTSDLVKLTAAADTSQQKPQTKHITDKKSEDDKAREKRIFEFAGETIVVENNVIKERIKTTDSAAAVSTLMEGPSTARRSGAGLSGVLGQLNKKNKLTTLEKSKLDWDTYKKENGIEEEVESHNKGKDGYLERQDFLERADHRQFEIERELRMSRRSNR